MLGTRGIWEDGWKAATVHAPFTGRGHIDQDQWELYHLDADRSESTDLAKQYPEKVAALKKAWYEEARINLALPVDDRTASEILLIERPSAETPRDRYIYYPGAAPVPEDQAVSLRNRSFKILANVEITNADVSGVIFAQGSRFGGHVLFIKDQKLHYGLPIAYVDDLARTSNRPQKREEEKSRGRISKTGAEEPVIKVVVDQRPEKRCGRPR